MQHKKLPFGDSLEEIQLFSGPSVWKQNFLEAKSFEIKEALTNARKSLASAKTPEELKEANEYLQGVLRKKNDYLRSALGLRLENRRIEIGLTLAECAVRTGLSRTAISNLEKGDHSKISTVFAVAEALSYPLEKLFQGLDVYK